jgi:hypothetical protein
MATFAVSAHCPSRAREGFSRSGGSQRLTSATRNDFLLTQRRGLETVESERGASGFSTRFSMVPPQKGSMEERLSEPSSSMEGARGGTSSSTVGTDIERHGNWDSPSVRSSSHCARTLA